MTEDTWYFIYPLSQNNLPVKLNAKFLYQLRSFLLKIRGKKSQTDLHDKSDSLVHKSKKAKVFTHGLIKASAKFPCNSLNSTH